MRVLVTGATGFLGRHVLALRPAGHEVEAFVRASSDLSRLPPGLRVRKGDLGDPDSLTRALEGADAVVNLASLGFGHAPGIVEACRRVRLERALFIGTTAVFTKLPAASKAVRLEAERLVRESGLPWTLLRPTMMYGTPGDRNIWRLIRFLRWSPVAPLPGGGRGLHQPVFVEDAAKAVWAALERPAAVGKAYNLAGARALTLEEMVGTVARLLGRKVAVVPVPSALAVAGAALARAVPFLPRVTREQILRLGEDKTVDLGPAREGLGFEPLDFEAGVARELEWTSAS